MSRCVMCGKEVSGGLSTADGKIIPLCPEHYKNGSFVSWFIHAQYTRCSPYAAYGKCRIDKQGWCSVHHMYRWSAQEWSAWLADNIAGEQSRSVKMDWYWFRLAGWLEEHQLGALVKIVETIRALSDMTVMEWLRLLRGSEDEDNEEY